MTKSRWEEDPQAISEADQFYRFIGEYVICYQWFESRIEEIIILGRGQENREETVGWLAKKTNAQKIDAFFDLVIAPAPFVSDQLEGWDARLEALVHHLHAERQRRNGILHSQFLFDFLAIGAGVLRTNAKRQDGAVVRENEDLSKERCDQIMSELAHLGMELNMVCVQLLHLHRPIK